MMASVFAKMTGAAVLAFVATAGPVAAQAGAGGQGQVPTQGQGRGRGAPAPGRGAAQGPTAPNPARNIAGGSGPNDQADVDPVAADRARPVWAGECINCHGTQARGTDSGPNLTRSLVVLHDRYGSELAPFLMKGHMMQSGRSSTVLTSAQVVDLAHFLRQRVHDGFRGSPLFQVGDVLTGDKAAGASYFNGAGGCASCHSVTGNLAGIGARYSPVDLQQRMLFPTPARGGGAGARGGGGAAGGRGAAPLSQVTVTVTPASGPAVSGALVQMDDFTVTLRDATGISRTFTRSASLKVAKTVPLQAHYDLLDRITDKNIHDLVAYLETVK